jgi:hypothetical protein
VNAGGKQVHPNEGDLRAGYFYTLAHASEFSPDVDYPFVDSESIIFFDAKEERRRQAADESRSSVSGLELTAIPRRRCSQPGCADYPSRFSTEFDFTAAQAHGDLGGSADPLIIPDMQRRFWVVTRALADKLARSPLSGVGIGEIRKVATSRGGGRPPKLALLNFRGRYCLRGRRLAAGVPNCCPHCGREPLVCPECDQFYYECPRCGLRSVHGPLRQRTSPYDKHLIEAPDFDETGEPILSRIGGVTAWLRFSVIHFARWDGSDLNYGNVVTHRAVQYLIRIGAAPFHAIPCWVDVAALSRQDLERLETARAPLNSY